MGILGIVCLGITGSCQLFDRPEAVPAYLYIRPFTLTTDAQTEGSASSKITDAWVYVNDQPVGTVEIPAKIPVLQEGNQKITIAPGIMKDGKSVERVIYPFYKGFSLNLDLQPGVIDTVNPSTTYADGLTFHMINDFELGNDFTGMSLTGDPQKVFEGMNSGEILINTVIPDFEASSSGRVLPGKGTRIFLEMDYRCDGPFKVYLQSNDFLNAKFVQHYIITVTKKEVWNKIYIDLTNAVSGNPADTYQLIFKGSLPEGANVASYLFDNVKIVSF